MTALVRRVQVGVFASLEAQPAAETGAPVLFVHGFTGSKEDATPVLERCAAAGHRALAYDQRGMYETPGPQSPSAYSLDAWAADIVTVAHAWAGRPVHLIGHSFGGYVARAAVLADPAAFASVVLLDTGRGPTVAASDMGRAEFLRALRAGGPAAVWTDDPGASAARAALMRERFFATEPAALTAAGIVLADPPPMVAALAATGVPALVVYGSGENLWPRAELDGMARELGRDPVVIAGAGHSPNQDEPDALVEELLTFWREAVSTGR